MGPLNSRGVAGRPKSVTQFPEPPILRYTVKFTSPSLPPAGDGKDMLVQPLKPGKKSALASAPKTNKAIMARNPILFLMTSPLLDRCRLLMRPEHYSRLAFCECSLLSFSFSLNHETHSLPRQYPV